MISTITDTVNTHMQTAYNATLIMWEDHGELYDEGYFSYGNKKFFVQLFAKPVLNINVYELIEESTAW